MQREEEEVLLMDKKKTPKAKKIEKLQQHLQINLLVLKGLLILLGHKKIHLQIQKKLYQENIKYGFVQIRIKRENLADTVHFYYMKLLKLKKGKEILSLLMIMSYDFGVLYQKNKQVDLHCLLDLLLNVIQKFVFLIQK